MSIFPSDGLLAQRLTPNLKDQVICDRGHCMVGGEEEDRNIMEEPSAGLHEKQKHGRR